MADELRRLCAGSGLHADDPLSIQSNHDSFSPWSGLSPFSKAAPSWGVPWYLF